MPALPPRWEADPELRGAIPAPHDYQTFARIPEAPDRYAACIVGGGVFDLKRRCFLKPQMDKKTGRARFRLNRNEPTKGRRNSPTRMFYARIILTAVHGPRGRSFQAHHSDHDRTHDSWDNLAWTTARANKRLAVQHADRSGEANPNADLSFAMLGLLIEAYDDAKRRLGETGTRHLATQLATRFKITPTQVRRLANEKSRAAEVQTIRRGIRARAEKAKDRLLK